MHIDWTTLIGPAVVAGVIPRQFRSLSPSSTAPPCAQCTKRGSLSTVTWLTGGPTPTLLWPSGKLLSTGRLRLGTPNGDSLEVVLANFIKLIRIVDEARSPGSMGNERSTPAKVRW